MKLIIISASVRDGRKSHRAALFFKNFLIKKYQADVSIADLNELNFPLFEERLRFQKNKTPEVVQFAEKIKQSDGVLIITPEYNGGYPASLKNIIDLMYDEWRRKPVAIATVSDGMFGGMQAITSLQFILWKIRAWTVPAMFPMPQIDKNFDADGTAIDIEGTEKRATVFCDEWMWCIEANRRMQLNH